MAGSRPGKLAVGEEWRGLEEGRLALQKFVMQSGSCPALYGALNWIYLELPGAAEKGIEIEGALFGKVRHTIRVPPHSPPPPPPLSTLKNPEWTRTSAAAGLCL